MSSEQATSLGEGGDTAMAQTAPISVDAPAEGAEPGGSTDQTVDPILGARLSEELNKALESPDPVAGLDRAIQTVADELSRGSEPDVASGAVAGSEEEMAGAIETLVRVALEMDDPVAALEEGADSLAEALAERDAMIQARLAAAREQHIDEQAAYRHARLHRVSELIDVGYGVDAAISITNANEAEVRARSLAMGRNPMEAIYQYAVRNGYRGRRPYLDEPSAGRQHSPAPPRAERQSPMAALAQLSEEAFAEATKGDRWQRLMQP